MKLLEIINKRILLKEYHGENFMKPLIDAIENMYQIQNDIQKKIYDNEFGKTTVDRDFKYVEKYLKEALKYAKLGSKAIDQITS